MDYEQGQKLLENAVKGFHGEVKKMYGQISLRLDDKTYMTTGGNIALSEITSDTFEICDIKSGDLGEIFSKRNDINAIIFGCSPDTVKASRRDADIPSALEDLAQLTGPVLHIISDAAPASILSALQSSDVCLIKGVGVIAASSNLNKAVAGVQIVEKACEAEVHGELIGGTVALNGAEAAAIRDNFINDYTKRNEGPAVPFVGFNENEFALRNELIEYGKDLVRRDLSYGSWGNLSVKLNDDEMLITPSSMDYFEIKIEDIVRVNIHTLEYGDQRRPSSEAPMHAQVYRDHPEAGAIIHTHSNGISVFAACEAGFALDDSNMQDLIGDIVLSKAAPAGSELLGEVVSNALSESHACVIPHHGAVFYGPSLDVVFAISEAVELRARKILNFDMIPDDEEEKSYGVDEESRTDLGFGLGGYADLFK